MKMMTLKEAFRVGIVEVGDYVAYEPKTATCKLSQSETGHFSVQTFSTETLGWRLYEYNTQMILIADRPTKQILFLRGIEGYKNGVGVINKLCYTLYQSSVANMVKTISTNIYNEVDCMSKDYKDSFWIVSACETTRGEPDDYVFAICGIGYVDRWGWVKNSNQLWETFRYGYSKSGGVIPVICLKSDVLISDLGQEDCGSEQRPWTITTEKNELLNLINEGEQLIQKGQAMIEYVKKLLEKM